MKFFSNKNTSWLLLISGLVLLLEISAGFLLYFLKEKATGAEQPTATAQSLSLVLGAFTPPDIPINLQLRGPLQQEQETRRPEPMKLSLEGISAKAILAYDAQTAEILAEKNSQLQLPIASLTKLLTAWVVYQHGNLNDIVETKTAAGIDVKPVLNLQVDDKVKVLDLFNAMLVGSCNDAAEILADYTALKTSQNFVELMNQAARDLGMSDSRFSNPLGFDYKANYSTAADLQKFTENEEGIPMEKVIAELEEIHHQEFLKRKTKHNGKSRRPR